MADLLHDILQHLLLRPAARRPRPRLRYELASGVPPDVAGALRFAWGVLLARWRNGQTVRFGYVLEYPLLRGWTYPRSWSCRRIQVRTSAARIGSSSPHSREPRS